MFNNVDTLIMAAARAAKSGHTDIGSVRELGVTERAVRTLAKMGTGLILSQGRVLLSQGVREAYDTKNRAIQVISRLADGSWVDVNGRVHHAVAFEETKDYP